MDKKSIGIIGGLAGVLLMAASLFARIPWYLGAILIAASAALMWADGFAMLKAKGPLGFRERLLRMRMSGAYGVALCGEGIGAVFLLLGLAGRLLYQSKLRQFGAADNGYAFRKSLGALSGNYAVLLAIGGAFFLGALAVLLYLYFVAPAANMDQRLQKIHRKEARAAQYVAAALVVLVMIFPIYWMVISSLKSSEELLLAVPTLWPAKFQWGNYVSVLKRAPFQHYLFNTLVSTFFIMAGETILGILAAYGFAKGNFRHKNFWFLFVLGALMIPIQVTFVPTYVMVSRLNWLNSFPGLIVPNLVSAYFIFMLRQTFMAVDNSYLEAGKVDGMGRIQTITHVLCPMCLPTIITVSIITFINGWNSYFWPKMIAPLEKRRTIAVGVTLLRRTFAGMETSNYNEIMAGAVMAIIPIVLLFLVLQKYIMTGMSKAAMK